MEDTAVGWIIATGIATIATAVFTGGTLWWAIWRRDRPNLLIEIVDLVWISREFGNASVRFRVRNLGTLPAIGVSVRRTRPGVGSVQVGERVDSIAAGSSEMFSIDYATENFSKLDENSGTYLDQKPRIDAKRDLVEVSSLRPPRYKRELSHQILVAELIDQLALRERMEK